MCIYNIITVNEKPAATTSNYSIAFNNITKNQFRRTA